MDTIIGFLIGTKAEKKERKGKWAEEYDQLAEEIRNRYFNCFIYGMTGSGKTYFLMNVMYPIVKDLYQQVYVFSRATNFDEYKKAIPKCVFIAEQHLPLLKAIMKKQEIEGVDEVKTKSQHKTVYKENILFIWDDYLDLKTFKDDIFKSQFYNGRHYQISVIVMSQVTNNVITTDLRGNTGLSVYFRVSNSNQRTNAINAISECIYNVNDEMSKRDVHNKANKMYGEYISGIKYGHMIINSACEILYPRISLVETLKPKKQLDLEESSSDEEINEDIDKLRKAAEEA